MNVHGATLEAVLKNADAPSKSFSLTLTAYDDGFVRLQVDEPGTGRYKITDITNAQVESRKTTWQQTQKDAKGTTLVVGSASVQLGFQPFRLSVSVAGKPAVNINSRDMFNFEHRRKQEVRGGVLGGCKHGSPRVLWRALAAAHHAPQLCAPHNKPASTWGGRRTCHACAGSTGR